MILAQLKVYLAGRGPVPIAGLASRFEVAPDTMRGMLAHLIRKGLVHRLVVDEACGGCTKCDADVQELYAWTDPRQAEDRPAPGCERTPPASLAVR
jgi:hypothetical protein